MPDVFVKKWWLSEISCVFLYIWGCDQVIFILLWCIKDLEEAELSLSQDFKSQRQASAVNFTAGHQGHKANSGIAT